MTRKTLAHIVVRNSPFIVLIAAAIATGCRQQSSEVRGVLVDVQSREIVNADAITLRDGGGTLHTFQVSPEVAADRQHPNTASHLRQHMALADPVIVRYRDTAEGRLAVQIVDASATP
jgi:hypothetical protein